jgi:hypothetical protein
LAACNIDFDQKQAAVLNRVVMVYALPLVLFAGIAPEIGREAVPTIAHPHR